MSDEREFRVWLTALSGLLASQSGHSFRDFAPVVRACAGGADEAVKCARERGYLRTVPRGGAATERERGALAASAILSPTGDALTPLHTARRIARRIDGVVDVTGGATAEHLAGAADRLREIASELVGLAAERAT